MNKNRKYKIVLSIFLIILGLLVFSNMKEGKWIKQGDIQHENLSVLGNSIFQFSDIEKVKIGLSNMPKVYTIQYFEKPEHGPLKLLEENTITLPKKYAYFTIQKDRPRIRIEVFDKKKKLYKKDYFLTMYRKEDEPHSDEQGDHWEEFTFYHEDFKEHLLIYSWSLQHSEKGEIGMTISSDGLEELLQGDFKRANEILKAGNFILLSEKM